MTSTKHVHFLGIGGSGASAIAHIAQAQGFKISGCDQEPENEFTSDFKHVPLLTGHSPNHLEGVDILAVTPAIYSLDPDNPELQEASKRSIEILTWQEFMGKYLEEDKFVIAICGTHGKSTTTAMVATLLEDAGLDPTVELGATVNRWGKNYRIGQGRYFVTEADEFNDNFLVSHPDIAIVTNIEMDHPEYFKDFEALKDSYFKFFLQTKQSIIGNLADPVVADLLKDVMKETKLSCFDFTKNELNFPLKVIGDHNIRNAQAALQLGILLGVEPLTIHKSLENFTGIGRRFEKLGEFRGALFYSDFGHHPTEIRVTAEAISKQFPDRKIVLIFQPHMFSRTKYLFDQFVEVFENLSVNKTIITDIYPSREIDTGLVNSQELVDAIKKDSVEYHPINELPELIKNLADKDTVLVFMGAGPIDQIGIKLLKE